ncbi:MAG: hypothetical protein HC797_05330 [Anaerolineales bacterium]|nr:hypothetical protein [Anaerolineales bacterium]
MANQFPTLFEAETIQLITSQWIMFATTIPALLFLFAKSKNLKIKFIEENWQGLLLASIFFSVYFFTRFNFQST